MNGPILARGRLRGHRLGRSDLRSRHRQGEPSQHQESKRLKLIPSLQLRRAALMRMFSLPRVSKEERNFSTK